MRETATRSKYNGLQLEANRRFAKGLGFGIAYTYAKNMDNRDDPAATRRKASWPVPASSTS